MAKHTHLPLKAGYTFRKVKFTNEQAFADEMRAAVNKVCDLMNTGKEHGITVEFQISTFGEGGLNAPNVKVMKNL